MEAIIFLGTHPLFPPHLARADALGQWWIPRCQVDKPHRLVLFVGFGHYQARVLERLYFSVVSTSQMGSNRSAENVQNVFL